MKIFLDTADTSVIRKHFATGLIDGVTTNPTQIRKSGRDPEEVYTELADDIGVRDISMEVVGDSATMTAEGKRLSEKFEEETERDKAVLVLNTEDPHFLLKKENE